MTSGKKVVSYSVFGSDCFYWCNVPVVLAVHHLLMPDWELRLHHDGRLEVHPYGKALRRASENGLLKLVRCNAAPSTLSMLWRLQPLWDEDVEVVACRDIDSLPCPRDRRCLDAFIETGLAAHVIRDHVSHGALMMGGTVAFRRSAAMPVLLETTTLDYATPLHRLRGWPEAGKFKKAANWVSFVRSRPVASGLPSYFWHKPGEDQQFLADHVWLPLLGNICEHVLGGGLLPNTANPPCSGGSALSLAVPDVSEQIVEYTNKLVPYIGAAGLRERGMPEVVQGLRQLDCRAGAIFDMFCHDRRASEYLERCNVTYASSHRPSDETEKDKAFGDGTAGKGTFQEATDDDWEKKVGESVRLEQLTLKEREALQAMESAEKCLGPDQS